MKDRIIEGYLRDFTEKHALQTANEATAFEHFINYCTISREHPENFDFEDVSVGGGGDYGIDGIAILVNDHLVTSVEAIDFFKKNLRRIDARFLFIQSKTGDKFDSGEMGNFLFGVRTFFNTAAPVAANSGIETAVIETVVARDQSKELALMPLYRQRIQRAYEKYKKELNELQDKRKATQTAELEEARPLFQLADTQGLAYDPKKDGFVFSLHFIRAQAERHHRLILAKRTETDHRRKNNLAEITRAAGKAA